jgi:hypothetical protein
MRETMYFWRWFCCAITTGTPHRRPVRARTGAESYVWLLASALPDVAVGGGVHELTAIQVYRLVSC